ncbi:hypothetical protein Clacol_005052 [Clathrus columnatus]|uniref:Uncharacterized protein n=1 Tax=Clathrus columnatus TaxID=1419009 RepID=A0AAV5ADP0_9AGAM|nr:hypothetical protein Clacol_005052 [Clathrus columnatus]
MIDQYTAIGRNKRIQNPVLGRSTADQNWLLTHVPWNDAKTEGTTVSSLYVPSISDAGGLDDGSFLIGSLAGVQDGTSTYILLLGSTDTDADDGPTPTLTLVEASTTAHLFGAAALDDQGDTATIDIQCTINGDSSSCEEVAGAVVSGVTAAPTTSAFTETVSPIAVTLVNTLPSVTSNPAQSTQSPSSLSSSGSGSPTGLIPPTQNPSPSSPQVTPGNTPLTAPSNTPSSNGTTLSSAAPGSSSSTTRPPNAATYHTLSVLLCAFPLAAVSMLL